ncbi:DUF5133 domain-containing protein [Streptomyces sp. NPDC002643]
MLLPTKNEVARHLRRYRMWERVMLASPTDPAARDRFEDSGYTLCVLMGKRCAREAVAAAERYLQTSLFAHQQEETALYRQEKPSKPVKPAKTVKPARSGKVGKAGRSRAARRGRPSGRRPAAEQ